MSNQTELKFTNSSPARLDLALVGAVEEANQRASETDSEQATENNQKPAMEIPQFSRSNIQAFIKAGLVKVNGATLTNPATKVKQGDVITLTPKPLQGANKGGLRPQNGAGLLPQKVDFAIGFEDEFLLVVDKPAGLVVHPGAGNHSGTLANGLMEHCGGKLSVLGGEVRPGIVHRLDKDTSGLLVVAKDDITHSNLARQFEHRIAKRLYWAAVHRVIAPMGVVEAPLARHRHNRLKIAVDPKGKAAKTRWRRLYGGYGADGSPLASLIVCSLYSGRTHQIRVHMASLGHPIWGDRLYGGSGLVRGQSRGQVKGKWAGSEPVGSHSGSNNQAHSPSHSISHSPISHSINRQALHALRLSFVHPHTKKRMRFRSKLPQDLQALEQTLRSLGQ